MLPARRAAEAAAKLEQELAAVFPQGSGAAALLGHALRLRESVQAALREETAVLKDAVGGASADLRVHVLSELQERSNTVQVALLFRVASEGKPVKILPSTVLTRAVFELRPASGSDGGTGGGAEAAPARVWTWTHDAANPAKQVLLRLPAGRCGLGARLAGASGCLPAPGVLRATLHLRHAVPRYCLDVRCAELRARLAGYGVACSGGSTLRVIMRGVVSYAESEMLLRDGGFRVDDRLRRGLGVPEGVRHMSGQDLSGLLLGGAGAGSVGGLLRPAPPFVCVVPLEADSHTIHDLPASVPIPLPHDADRTPHYDRYTDTERAFTRYTDEKDAHLRVQVGKAASLKRRYTLYSQMAEGSASVPTAAAAVQRVVDGWYDECCRSSARKLLRVADADDEETAASDPVRRYAEDLVAAEDTCDDAASDE